MLVYRGVISFSVVLDLSFLGMNHMNQFGVLSQIVVLAELNTNNDKPRFYPMIVWVFPSLPSHPPVIACQEWKQLPNTRRVTLTSKRYGMTGRLHFQPTQNTQCFWPTKIIFLYFVHTMLLVMFHCFSYYGLNAPVFLCWVNTHQPWNPCVVNLRVTVNSLPWWEDCSW